MEASIEALVADLEASLEAAMQLAKAQSPSGKAEVIPDAEPAKEIPSPGQVASVDTSGMPGGVDSAPVSGGAPESDIQKIEHVAETELVDILGELKAGTSVSSIANKLLDQNGLASVVKAIGDLAGKVF